MREGRKERRKASELTYSNLKRLVQRNFVIHHHSYLHRNFLARR
jgi:hypothetical protein